jgi:hypothetical protein
MAQVPEDAIKAFITASQEISGGTKSSKEAKDKKAHAKNVIIQFMKNGGMSYIQVDHLFLHLKKNMKKPTVNAEFVARAYKEFQQTELIKLPQATIEQVAVKFGEYVFYLQRQMGEETNDLKVNQKKPMSAMLFDSFAAPPAPADMQQFG